MEHRHWCTYVHTPYDAKLLISFDVRFKWLANELP